MSEVRCESEWIYGKAKLVESRCRERVSKVRLYGTVPETDTGRRDEYSKAYGRIRVKELGKIHT